MKVEINKSVPHLTVYTDANEVIGHMSLSGYAHNHRDHNPSARDIANMIKAKLEMPDFLSLVGESTFIDFDNEIIDQLLERLENKRVEIDNLQTRNKTLLANMADKDAALDSYRQAGKARDSELMGLHNTIRKQNENKRVEIDRLETRHNNLLASMALIDEALTRSRTIVIKLDETITKMNNDKWRGGGTSEELAAIDPVSPDFAEALTAKMSEGGAREIARLELKLIRLKHGTPAKGSLWEHHGGRRYEVVGIANDVDEPRAKYPPTVIYKCFDGALWAGELSDWHRRMKLVESV